MMTYSPLLEQIDSQLCEHVSSLSEAARSSVRYSIVRLFGYGSRHVSFSLSSVEDVFELQVPRLQIRTGTPSKPAKLVDVEEDKRVLRSEIKGWWQAAAEHLDKLVSSLILSKEVSLMMRAGGALGPKRAQREKGLAPIAVGG